MRAPLAVATTVFAADQLTKLWVLNRLEPGLPIVVVPGLFHLTLVMNPGVAFGVFAGVPPHWRWLVMLFSVIALVLLCSLAARMTSADGRQQFAAAITAAIEAYLAS